MKLPRDFEDLLRLLGDHCVEHAIVGGYAVARYGHPRFTGDLDVLVRPGGENARRLLRALTEFGFGSVGLTVEDFLEPGRVVQLGVPPLRVDILTSIEGVSNDEVFSHLVADGNEDPPLRFISREDLIRNKRAAARPQDIADLDRL